MVQVLQFVIYFNFYFVKSEVEIVSASEFIYIYLSMWVWVNSTETENKTHTHTTTTIHSTHHPLPQFLIWNWFKLFIQNLGLPFRSGKCDRDLNTTRHLQIDFFREREKEVDNWIWLKSNKIVFSSYLWQDKHFADVSY